MRQRWDAKLLCLTDLSLVVYRSLSGLSLQVLSYTDGKPQEGVKIKLISRNASVLCQTSTDKDGFASFDHPLLQGEGGDEPVYVTAFKTGDTALIDLRQRATSLDDLISEIKEKPVHAVVYTDRDLYRKGEEVFYSVYLRDLKGRALKGQRLDLEILSHQGSLIESVMLADEGGGSYRHVYAISPQAPAGTYTLRLKTPDGALLDIRQFEVMSLVPRTVSTLLKGESLSDGRYLITLDDSYNYGVLARGLQVQGSLDLKVDHRPFDKWQEFSFGEDSSFDSAALVHESLSFEETDEKGLSALTLDPAPQNYAQEAVVNTLVFELNGQVSDNSHTFKVPGTGPQIGLQQTGALDFKANLTDQKGNLLAGSLDYTLYKVERTSQYVFLDGRWDQRTVQRQRAVSGGTIAFEGKEPHSFSFEEVNAGLYLLRVRCGDSSSSMLFSRGAALSSYREAPAKVELYLDKTEYESTDVVELSFDSPLSGYATLALGRYALDSLQSFKVQKGRNRLKVKLDDEAVPVSNIILSLYDQEGFKSICPRYIGTASFKVKDPKDDLTFEAQILGLIKLEEQVTVKIKASQVTGQGSAELFLVDKGILDLSKFAYQDPASVLSKVGSTALELYDNYGFLITRSQGYGSDEEVFKGLSAQSLSAISQGSVVHHQKIALKEGDNEITFAVPAFDGALKAALILSDDDSMRLYQDEITVHSELTATLNTPVYLQEGDEAQISLSLYNHEDPTDFKALVSCEGALQCSLEKTWEGLKDVVLPVTLKAEHSGTGSVVATITRSDGKVFETKRNLMVQTLSPLSLVNYAAVLPSGQSKIFEIDKFKRISHISGSLCAAPGLSAEVLLKEAGGRHLVTLFDKAALLKLKLATNLDAKERSLVQDQTDELALSSYANGFFGSDLEGSWLQSLYVTDSLCQAQAQGYRAGRELIGRALDTIEQELWWLSPLEKAMGYELLLKEGRTIDLSSLRYFFDEGEIENAQALAKLSQIFSDLGDSRRARSALMRGREAYEKMQDLEASLQTEQNSRARHELEAKLAPYKNSVLNDELNDLLQLYAAAEALQDPGAMEDLGLKLLLPLQRGYLSLVNLQMLHSLQEGVEGSCKVLSFDAQDAQRVEIDNDNGKSAFAMLSVTGELKEQEAPSDPRLVISKEYFNENGKALNPSLSLKAGQRVVVKITVQSSLPSYEKILATDLISPAFVYEGSLSEHALRYNFDLGEHNQSFVRPQQEDDRLLFLLNYQNSLTYFYVLRAASAGTYSLVPLQAQSLHAPHILSRTQTYQGDLAVEP